MLKCKCKQLCVFAGVLVVFFILPIKFTDYYLSESDFSNLGDRDRDTVPPIDPGERLISLYASSWNYINNTYGSACDSKAAAADFIKRKGNHHCPRSDWRLAIQKYDPLPDKNILVSGCNKGFDAIELHFLFDNPLNNSRLFNKQIWWSTLNSDGKITCGACSQCRHLDMDKAHPASHIKKGHPIVYCIEAMPTGTAQLAAAASSLGYDKQGLIVRNAAFVGSGAVKSVLFPDDSVTKESLRIGTGVPVEAFTLDNWAAIENVDIIDFLILDTEGYDAKVLMGGSQLLSDNRVRLLEFEVHTVGPWKNINLKDLLDYLDNVGMICFYASEKQGIWRITGSCWDDAYNSAKPWSNVVCAPIHDPLGKPYLPILEAMDQVPTHKAQH